MAINCTCLISSITILYSILALAREPGCSKWLALSKHILFPCRIFVCGNIPFWYRKQKHNKESIAFCKEYFGEDNQCESGFFVVVFISSRIMLIIF